MNKIAQDFSTHQEGYSSKFVSGYGKYLSDSFNSEFESLLRLFFGEEYNLYTEYEILACIDRFEVLVFTGCSKKQFVCKESTKVLFEVGIVNDCNTYSEVYWRS